MALFFTADTHFSDHRTINIHGRPFSSASEMDEALVQGWNALVSDSDEVWHLGNVARRPSDVPALLSRLNGTKHLVRGNHDPAETAAAAGWASVHDYAEFKSTVTCWCFATILSEAGTASTAAHATSMDTAMES